MQITFILLFLPHFFDVLLASPLIPRDLPQHDSFPLIPRLYDESGRQARSSGLGGLVARGDRQPTLSFEGCTEIQEDEIKDAAELAVEYIKDSSTLVADTIHSELEHYGYSALQLPREASCRCTALRMVVWEAR